MLSASTKVRRHKPTTTPTKLIAISNMLARAISVSKYCFWIRPPLAVTLKLPSLGLMSATSVGLKMYQASTASYTSFQNRYLNRPCTRLLVKLAWNTCGSA